MLVWGVERRSGPLWIAIGASLKAVSLLLALVYAGLGEWRRAGLALLLTAVMVAPAFLYDLSGLFATARWGEHEPHLGLRRSCTRRSRSAWRFSPSLRRARDTDGWPARWR